MEGSLQIGTHSQGLQGQGFVAGYVLWASYWQIAALLRTWQNLGGSGKVLWELEGRTHKVEWWMYWAVIVGCCSISRSGRGPVRWTERICCSRIMPVRKAGVLLLWRVGRDLAWVPLWWGANCNTMKYNSCLQMAPDWSGVKGVDVSWSRAGDKDTVAGLLL